jgi:hypothetical protein
MAVKQKGAAEAVQQKSQLLLDRLVIGTMRLRYPLLQLLPVDWTSPEITVLLRAPGHDSEASARPRRHSTAPRAVHDRRIHFVLGPVAVDEGSGRLSDHCATASLDRSPHQAVDQGILERR